MTPKHPWRRNIWRDTIGPLLWLLAAVVIIGGAAGIKSAHATPATPGQAYADEHASEICMLLDSHPTVGGLVDAVDTLRAAGLSPRESTVALLESVMYVCPSHAELLRQLAARHEASNNGGRVA